MVDFEVLGTDKEVSTDDPVGSVLNVVYVIFGAAVLFMALPIGQQLADMINGSLSGVLGTDVGDADTGGLTFGDSN